jgi:glycosyltransferase involved in cell wall biosynthesis
MDDRPLLLDVSRLIWRRWVGRLPTGIDRVCLAYLDHYGSRAQAVIQRQGVRRVLGPRTSERLFRLLASGEAAFRGDLMRTLVAEAFRSPGAPPRDRLYLNVGHTGLQEPGFVEWVRRNGVRPVYMVHDLIPITHPEYCRAGEAERHVGRMRTSLATAAGIIGNSQATLDALNEFRAAQDLAPVPTVAAWLGTDPIPVPVQEELSAAPTFVMLGTIEARKNHLLLLHVWRRMTERLGDSAPRLVVIGQRGWESEQVFDLLDRGARLRATVREVSACSDAELGAFFRSARALLFPSLVEGYGLPLVEALSAGTPVIASDLPVFREIGQGVPEFIDPLDGPSWERMILAYAMPDSTARATQLERLRSYQTPTWAGHFKAVDSWLETL